MKLTKKIILVGAAVLIAGTVSAQTSVPNTFTADTTASATEVNANFAALVSAINGLAADVAALEADAPTQSVSGRTYTFLGTRGFIEDQRTGLTNDLNLLFNVGAAEVDITFNANGSVTVGELYEEQVDLGWPTNGGAPFTSVTNIDSETTPAGSFSPTWTQDGALVSLTVFDLELYASADGSMLVERTFGHELSEDDDDDRFAWELGVWVEVGPQP